MNLSGFRFLSLRCVEALEVLEQLKRKRAEGKRENEEGSEGENEEEKEERRLFSERVMTAPLAPAVLSLLKSMSASPEEKLEFFEVFRNIIFSCLEALMMALEKCRDEIPNHFGVFESMKYRPDMQCYAILLDSVSSASQRYDKSHEEKTTYDIYKRVLAGHLENRSVSDVVLDLRGVEEDIPFLPSRLFWLRSFGLKSQILWSEFKDAFLFQYSEVMSSNDNEIVADDICSDAVARMKIHFRQSCRGFSSQIGSEQALDGDKDFLITRSAYEAFCCRSTVYEAFQRVCDPGTIILHSGNSRYIGSSKGFPTIKRKFLGYDIKQIACGGLHVVALSTVGSVFSWGENSFGQLGLGNRSSSSKAHVITLFQTEKKPCVKVACGYAYTGAITQDGEVYMWGSGENGRLGVGLEREHLLPTPLRTLQSAKICDIQAGSTHTCFLSSDGTLYTCGKFEYNGHGMKADLLLPKALPQVFFGMNTPPICQVATSCIGYHTIALTQNNTVFTWGHNRCGQLGFYDTAPSDDEAEVSPCGPLPRNFEGALYAPTPRQVDLQSTIAGKVSKVKQVSAGWGHSAALLQNGTLMMCGRNDSGQLGFGDRFECRTNERGHPFLDRFRIVTGKFEEDGVESVVCTGEQTLLCCRNNRIYGAGKNMANQLDHTVEHSRPSIRTFEIMPLFDNVPERKVIQACGSIACIYFLLGKSVVPSLQMLCQDVIRRSPQLYEEYTKSCADLYTSHSSF